MALEARFVDLDGVAVKDRLVTGSAASIGHRPFGGQPVDLAAMSTDDLSACTHVPVLTSLIFAMLSLSSRKRS
jgi:hypothetical protein